MAWTIRLSTQAKRYIKKINSEEQKRIIGKLDQIAEATVPVQEFADKLGGAEDLWKFRVGKHRVIFGVVEGELLILVARIAHRKDAYRNLDRVNQSLSQS